MEKRINDLLSEILEQQQESELEKKRTASKRQREEEAERPTSPRKCRSCYENNDSDAGSSARNASAKTPDMNSG
ncbi:hypothetical protein GN244_ATG01319 [Phytophthora infestans]|uniref:Uncharacterized protein n=1 Tax=Phytophthora infestans TaxID=4787 RepID=A0A833TT81_PHYIN|nr:hypothetical protein GN244_ATG01319 [Phytophthora infestans]